MYRKKIKFKKKQSIEYDVESKAHPKECQSAGFRLRQRVKWDRPAGAAFWWTIISSERDCALLMDEGTHSL